MEGLIIGVCGFIGSGKGTVGDILCNRFDFVHESFAKPLKDAVAAIFGWDRALLEGDTTESRSFRETNDLFWTEKLGYDVTPRLILQKFGTEVIRDNLGQSIWLNSLERRLQPKQQYVITDVRFKNEIALIKKLGGYVIQVHRENPPWYDDYLSHGLCNWIDEFIPVYYPEIHQSEWDWVDERFDYELINNKALDDLNNNVFEMLEYFYIDNLVNAGALNNEIK